MADKTSTESSAVENQPSNPLSRKLNKILETRLDNDKVKYVMSVFKNYFLCCKVK